MSTDTVGVVDERARLRALDAMLMSGRSSTDRFDLVVRLAQRLFEMPTVAVSLIGETEQWLEAKVGTEFCSGARSDSICDYGIRQPDTLVVEDLSQDSRFCDYPGVRGGVRFYAGHPISAPGGHRIGMLCMWDRRPRTFGARDQDLLRELAEWVEREFTADAELERAASVQRGLLPLSAPFVEGYQVAGRCLPAREVGGDFFDFFLVGDDLQLLVADVMGKGIGAALVAAAVRAVLRGANQYNDVAEAVDRAAASLELDFAQTATFVTLFSGRLNPVTGRLTYVDAGHGLSAIVRASGQVQQLAGTDPPLGATVGHRSRQLEDVLGVGDTFIAVSDGWLDFFSTMGEAAAAAVRVVLESSSAQEVVDQVARIAADFVPMDDLTVVAVRRQP